MKVGFIAEPLSYSALVVAVCTFSKYYKLLQTNLMLFQESIFHMTDSLCLDSVKKNES